MICPRSILSHLSQWITNMFFFMKMKKKCKKPERSRWVMIDQVEMLRFRSPSIFSHIPYCCPKKKHRQSPSRYIFHFHFTLYFRRALLYKKCLRSFLLQTFRRNDSTGFNINKWFLMVCMGWDILLFLGSAV